MEGCHMKMEAELEHDSSHAAMNKEYQESPAAGRNKNDSFSPRAFRGRVAQPTS